MYMVKHVYSVLVLEKDADVVPVDSNLIEQEIGDLAEVLPPAGAPISDEIAHRIIRSEIERAQSCLVSDKAYIATLRSFLDSSERAQAA